MSDSVGPHRQQPTRLPHPWDSPGKNTGVACHFLPQCVKVESESEVAQLCPTLSDPMDALPGSSVHGIFQARVLGCFRAPRQNQQIFIQRGLIQNLVLCSTTLYSGYYLTPIIIF